jgi:hypothetical protein
MNLISALECPSLPLATSSALLRLSRRRPRNLRRSPAQLVIASPRAAVNPWLNAEPLPVWLGSFSTSTFAPAASAWAAVASVQLCATTSTSVAESPATRTLRRQRPIRASSLCAGISTVIGIGSAFGSSRSTRACGNRAAVLKTRSSTNNGSVAATRTTLASRSKADGTDISDHLSSREQCPEWMILLYWLPEDATGSASTVTLVCMSI